MQDLVKDMKTHERILKLEHNLEKIKFTKVEAEKRDIEIQM